MEVRDKVVVVTGGGSGIGAALCRRFTAEGARAVVVADIDGEAAEAVASAVGGLGLRVDVAREDQLRDLVDRAVAEFGPIDLFCSNAGIVAGAGMGDGASGPFASDEDWQRSWQVNLMAHVYAARAVIPSMRARGFGYLLNTASAAGLLTDLGAQAYSVSKHAAVGVAEWLAITYGDRGIRVSCLCPQGVRTPMLLGVAKSGGGGHLTPHMIEPEAVAEAVVAGLAEERFLILPHPEVQQYFERKASDADRWLRGMRRLRERVLRGPSPSG